MASAVEQQELPPQLPIGVSRMGEKHEQPTKNKWRRLFKHGGGAATSLNVSPINCLDDGYLMHVFSFLSLILDRYNTTLVCHIWRFLACHPRLWPRVDRSIKDVSEAGVFPNIEAAVSAARIDDTILIAAGGVHITSNIQIRKPLRLIGAGELLEETTIVCSRGSDRFVQVLLICHHI